MYLQAQINWDKNKIAIGSTTISLKYKIPNKFSKKKLKKSNKQWTFLPSKNYPKYKNEGISTKTNTIDKAQRNRT